jgi:hypothetical protein
MLQRSRWYAAVFGEGALAHLHRRYDVAPERLLFCRDSVAQRDVFEPEAVVGLRLGPSGGPVWESSEP